MADVRSYAPYVLSLAILFAAPAQAQDGSSQSPQQTHFSNEIITLTNIQRQNHGCGPLRQNDQLTNAAQRHSLSMASNNYFSHTGNDGSTMTSRTADARYVSYSLLAENIAAGNNTPQATVEAWMHSPGHRANILNCALSEIGVGYAYDANSTYKHYATQDFGTPSH